ncbi:cytochrome P450 [Aspergillus sclerotiicarbonarius CBS 121057]|uniref:Cytochrome P450 n=1 Tax=Aspergillus sclerotiicarbonarius (strain CBS 121057 / IBT 28362) TaxID=1448318 RepID=A0A319ES30_ASPSB|nr:cytochrome P450 [Aspergillus sclerotiicarbonarius CBS 121057]
MESLFDRVTTHPYYSLVAVLVAITCLRYANNLRRAVASPLSNIPGPWYAPLTSLHLSRAFATGEIWKTVQAAHMEYGPIVRLGPRHIWIADKDAMQKILMTVDLPKVAMYAEISRDRASPGLFGEIRQDPHKRLKRFLSPAFTVSYIDNLEFLFAKCIEELISRYTSLLDEHLVVNARPACVTDLMDDIHKLALDIMGECSFGRGFGQTSPGKQIEQDETDDIWRSIPPSIFKGMRRRYQQTVYFKRFLRRLGLDLKFDWPKEMTTAIHSIIHQRTTVEASVRSDLLQHMVEEGKRPDSGSKMATRDIVDQMAEILLAGSETTSGTIACVFLELVRHPHVKKKLMASLPVLQPTEPIVSSKTVRTDARYEYLEACIRETLRLHPIASEMGRRTGKEPIELCGYLLPPHTVVSASYRDLHRNPAYWPQSLRFWPERWLAHRPPKVPSPDMHAYYPFSAGKHSCIGKNFAWAEMRMVTANLLSRFNFTEVPGQEIDYRQYITMQFQHGSWQVVLTPRY